MKNILSLFLGLFVDENPKKKVEEEPEWAPLDGSPVYFIRPADKRRFAEKLRQKKEFEAYMKKLREEKLQGAHNAS